jgi:alpha-D-xyloside xylohydrolase
MPHRMACRLVLGLGAVPARAARAASVSVTQEGGAVVVRNGADVMRVTVCDKDVVRVVASPDGKAAAIVAEPALAGQGLRAPTLRPARRRLGGTGSNTATGAGGSAASVAAKVIDTGAFRVSISLTNGTLTFLDADDRILLQEMGERPRIYEP